ncbi:MAG: HWE histidine kinase domain-containing protein [Aestuariivirga sp.]
MGVAGIEKATGDLAMRREAELAALFRLTDHLYRAQNAADIYEASLAAITSTLGCKRASILLFDAAGVLKFVAQKGLSASYVAAVEGHSPWRPGQPQPDPIFVENIEDTDEPAHIKETIKKEHICGLAFLPLISQGGVIGKFMTYYEQPHKFSPAEIELAVTIARQLGFGVERLRAEAARKKAADELRESEERFRLMSENAPVMIWMSDSNGGCLHLNRMQREFWDVEDDDLANFDWRSSMHPEDMPDIVKCVSEALASKTSVSLEGRYRNAQGIYRTLQTNAQPRLSPDGELLGMIGVNVDITERKEAEQIQHLLMNELNHRVKNTLAIVQSIANQTVLSAGSPGQFKTSFNGRLQALGAAHTLLTQNSWQGAEIQALVSGQVLCLGEDAKRISYSGPSVTLEAQVALHLALVLHELGTNACKYGALSVAKGNLSIKWSVQDGEDRVLVLHWQEFGSPKVTAPDTHGFGSVLIQQSLSAHGGEVTIDYTAHGLSCAIKLPIKGTTSRTGAYSTPSLFEVASAPEPASRWQHVRGKRVLVVDDEPLIAMDVTDILTEAGCEIAGPAETVEKAMSVINTTEFDAAILDVNLQGQRIDDLALELTRRNIPFAFLSGYGRDGLPPGFGQALLISKPFNSVQILDVVARLTEPSGTILTRLRQ